MIVLLAAENWSKQRREAQGQHNATCLVKVHDGRAVYDGEESQFLQPNQMRIVVPGVRDQYEPLVTTVIPQRKRPTGDDLGRLGPCSFRVPIPGGFNGVSWNRREQIVRDEFKEESSAGLQIHDEREFIRRVNTKIRR